MEIKGFVNINKPSGMTSSDVVVKVRGIFRRAVGEKVKVGHLGTLDPEATGVLPVAIGSATKLFDFAQKKKKTYLASFTFGKQTDTLDCAGKFIKTNQRIPNIDEIEKIVSEFIGEILQVPPQYSAKSINGIRAYDLAREGKTVELNAKTVNIFSIELQNKKPICNQNDYELNSKNSSVCNAQNSVVDIENLVFDTFILRICCGSGTYIRALARDFGEKLGTVAYMSKLEREKSGEFFLDNSVTFAEFEQNPIQYLLPLDYMLKSLPKYYLPSEVGDKFLNGVKVNLALPDGQFSVYYNNNLLGLGENVSGNLKLIRL